LRRAKILVPPTYWTFPEKIHMVDSSLLQHFISTSRMRSFFSHAFSYFFNAFATNSHLSSVGLSLARPRLVLIVPWFLP
jgi:hypothetical protein